MGRFEWRHQQTHLWRRMFRVQLRALGQCGSLAELHESCSSLCLQSQMRRLFVCVVCTALIRDLFSAQLNLHKFLGECAWWKLPLMLAAAEGADCPHIPPISPLDLLEEQTWGEPCNFPTPLWSTFLSYRGKFKLDQTSHGWSRRGLKSSFEDSQNLKILLEEDIFGNVIVTFRLC